MLNLVYLPPIEMFWHTPSSTSRVSSAWRRIGLPRGARVAARWFIDLSKGFVMIGEGTAEGPW